MRAQIFKNYNAYWKRANIYHKYGAFPLRAKKAIYMVSTMEGLKYAIIIFRPHKGQNALFIWLLLSKG